MSVYPYLSEIFNIPLLTEALEVVFSDKSHKSHIDSISPQCAYGTAGFRTKGHLLFPVVFRVPFITILRSTYLRCVAVATNTNKTEECSHGPTCFIGVNSSSVGDLGLMITASHNPCDDNGLKIVDADGGMLEMDWEELATEVCNERSVRGFLGALEKLLTDKCVHSLSLSEGYEERENCQIISSLLRKESDTDGNVCRPIRLHVGRDTRPSGEELLAILNSAVEIINKTLIINSISLEVHDHGVISTPILHAMVYWNRYNGTPLLMEGFRLLKCHMTHESNISPFTYRDVMLNAFKYLSSVFSLESPRTVFVDCANGVGATVMSELLSISGGNIITSQYEFISVNDSTCSPCLLNKDCGADYVQKNKEAPRAFMKLLLEKLRHEENINSSVVKEGKVSTNDISRRYGFYCFDGDADRVVSFVPIPKNLNGTTTCTTPIALNKFEEEVTFELLDGDRISVLLASLLQRLTNDSASSSLKSASVGVVQTAYANGASKDYINNVLKLQTHCVATGVKHLHPKAESMDVGIYFEANGHGTMLLSNRLFINDAYHGDVTLGGDSIVPLRDILVAFRMLLSQCCGDAIADLLACEVSFNALGWNGSSESGAVMATKWRQLYTDFPSVSDKVTVCNPSIIKNTCDQQRITQPAELQDAIDAIVSQYSTDSLGVKQHCRTFVRPSGTEPIVRIYTENISEEIARKVSEEVAKAVVDVCK